MMKEKMNVWITKYALTRGIERACVERSTAVEGMVLRDYEYFNEGDWHVEWNDAITRAEYMREKRLRSLKKQIAKLEALEFGKASRVSDCAGGSA